MMDRASKAPQRPTMDEYGDHDLFGPRIETYKSLDRFKASNDSECVVFAVGAFAGKEKFRLRDLIGTDKRLRQMMQGLEVSNPWPIQRYSWPKIQNSSFANLFIAPEAAGKTYALLLYLVSKCISAAPMDEADELLNSETSNQFVPTDHSDLEEFIIHPKYIIISSSQDKVDALYRKIDLMKQQAYGSVVSDDQRRMLTPVARTISSSQDDEKLSLRCNESEIIIASPPALLRCLRLGYLNFAKCKKVFFDDLDIALQLQNDTVREIIKAFLVQTQTLPRTADQGPNAGAGQGQAPACQVHIFSRKWTDLVRHFVGIFPQRILLFASLAEAAVYTNIRFEVELCAGGGGNGVNWARLSKISSTLKSLVGGGGGGASSQAKVAIVCRSDDEAEAMCAWLNEHGHKAKLLLESEGDPAARAGSGGQRGSAPVRDLVFVLSDSAIEFEVEYSTRRRPLNDVAHLIHATIPDDMLVFDQRFRLLYKNIQDGKSDMTSTLMLAEPVRQSTSRQIYDLISRSGSSLMATKLSMRDFVAGQSSPVCWRWATTGLCRLEKLSREDRFGSYCFDRHALASKRKLASGLTTCDADIESGLDGVCSTQKAAAAAAAAATTGNRWPREGLMRVTLTHIVSPSEFYFWFESRRSGETGATWTRFEQSGKAYMKTIQRELDKLRDTPIRSVALADVKRGRIFGVHFPQECRVDRVLLLDELGVESKKASLINYDLEYSKQVRVLKMDYGSRLDVYVRNLIELPDELRRVPAQSHRGLHLGFKPTDNEPNWPYKSKRQFYELIYAKQEQTISAWLRLNSDGCFWFEGLLVSRKLSNIDSDEIDTFSPHWRLERLGLAEAICAEPSALPPSNRKRAECRWEQGDILRASQFAFLDRAVPSSDVYVLDVAENLDIIVRLYKFNKFLISLEDELKQDYEQSKLERQVLLEPGVICLARVTPAPVNCINRVKLIKIGPDQQLGAGQQLDSPESAPARSVTVECLDHGDTQVVSADELLRASLAHIKKFPFQAIRKRVANLNPALLDDPACIMRLKNLLIDLVRDSNNQNLVLQCRLNTQGDIYLYLPPPPPPQSAGGKSFVPLYMCLSEYGIQLHDAMDEGFERALEACSESRDDFENSDSEQDNSDPHTCLVKSVVLELLRDIATSELASGAA